MGVGSPIGELKIKSGRGRNLAGWHLKKREPAA